MLNRIVSKLITKIKNEEYHLDSNISSVDILIILWEKFKQAVRGLKKGLFFKKKHGIIFVGKSVKIKHARKIVSDGGLNIGDYCQINALSKDGIKFGNNVSLGSGTIIECTGVIRELGESLCIGNHVGFAQNCFIEVRGKINIGDDCIFAPYVSIAAENHNFEECSTPIRLQGTSRKGITIENDCWIGTKVTILDGVTIGKGSIVAAGAVVTRDIPEYSIAGGIPARVLKKRN